MKTRKCQPLASDDHSEKRPVTWVVFRLIALIAKQQIVQLLFPGTTPSWVPAAIKITNFPRLRELGQGL